MKQNIKPLAGFILLEPVEEERTKSGIVLPESASKEKPAQGKVIAVGAKKKADEKDDLHVGDVVLFRQYGPDEIKVDDKKYLIAKKEDILAIIA